MIKDYWVYQKRQSETAQWALYIVKEFEPRKPETVVLDVTVYSEDIGTPTSSKSFVDWHFDTVGGYVEEIVKELREFCRVTRDDRKQLETSITRILMY